MAAAVHAGSAERCKGDVMGLANHDRGGIITDAGCHRGVRVRLLVKDKPCDEDGRERMNFEGTLKGWAQRTGEHLSTSGKYKIINGTNGAFGRSWRGD